MSEPQQDESWWRRRASLLTDLQRRTARRAARSRQGRPGGQLTVTTPTVRGDR